MLETIKKAMKQVWTVDIVQDYRHKFLLKEDTLKNSVYYHLRNRLGDVFLTKHNLRIFTEYYMNGQKIDLAIVAIDVARSEDNHLSECVTDVVIAHKEITGTSLNTSPLS